MSEAWQNTDGQQANRGYNGGNPTFGSRNFNNSNFNQRGGPRRNDAMNGGGYQGQRPSYANGNGYQQRSFGQNGGAGRQHFYGGGERQPRMNFNNGGAPRTYNNFDPNSASSKMDIDSKKVGMVIGRGGGKIREIQDNFNVHVKIDRDPGLNGLTGVTIRGEEESIAQAKQFIQELIAVK